MILLFPSVALARKLLTPTAIWTWQVCRLCFLVVYQAFVLFIVLVFDKPFFTLALGKKKSKTVIKRPGSAQRKIDSVSPQPPRPDFRPRVLHLLALRPLSRTDLEQRLKIPPNDPALTTVLDEVCNRMYIESVIWWCHGSFWFVKHIHVYFVQPYNRLGNVSLEICGTWIPKALRKCRFILGLHTRMSIVTR